MRLHVFLVVVFLELQSFCEISLKNASSNTDNLSVRIMQMELSRSCQPCFAEQHL